MITRLLARLFGNSSQPLAASDVASEGVPPRAPTQVGYSPPLRAISPIEAVLGHTLPDLGDGRHFVQAMSPDDLVATEQRMIDETCRVIGMKGEEYELVLRDVYRRFAAFVQLLPASQADHHCDHGGLFRHGVEVAFQAARFAESTCFFATDCESKLPRCLDLRWRVATVVAGLLHHIGIAIADIEVTDPSDQLRWNAFAGSLPDWLASINSNLYRFRWRQKRLFLRHQDAAVNGACAVLGPEFYGFLGQHNDRRITQALLATIQDVPWEFNPIAEFVKKADALSCRNELDLMLASLASSRRPKPSLPTMES